MSRKKRSKKSARKEEKPDQDEEEGSGEQESASGLFKEAIAALESVDALGAEKKENGEKEEKAGADVKAEEAKPEPGPAEKEGEPDEKDREAGREKVAEKESEEKKGEAEGGDARDESPKPEVEEAEAAEKVEEAEAAPAVGDGRTVTKTVRRKSGSEEEIEVYEPKEYELHGDVVKFECRCGKRVSAPADSKRSIGKCPKCGVRLVLPKTGSETGPKPAAAGEAAVPAPSAPARADSGPDLTAAPARADSGPDLTTAPEALPEPEPLPPPAWVSRLVAFQIDLAAPAALFFALFYLLRYLETEPLTYWSVALVTAGVAWVVAAIVLPTAVSASLGMLVAGLRYRGPDGRPLTLTESLGRSAAGLLLWPLAPLSLADAGGRTTADHVTGCVVVPVGQEAMGAVPSAQRAAGRSAFGAQAGGGPDRAAPLRKEQGRAGSAEERHAPNTLRKRHRRARRRRT